MNIFTIKTVSYLKKNSIKKLKNNFNEIFLFFGKNYIALKYNPEEFKDAKLLNLLKDGSFLIVSNRQLRFIIKELTKYNFELVEISSVSKTQVNKIDIVYDYNDEFFSDLKSYGYNEILKQVNEKNDFFNIKMKNNNEYLILNKNGNITYRGEKNIKQIKKYIDYIQDSYYESEK